MITLTALGLMAKTAFSGVVRVAKTIPLKVWVALAVLLLLYAYGSLRDQWGYDRAQTEYAQASLASERDHALKVLELERVSREQIKTITEVYNKAIKDSYEKSKIVSSDVRSGKLRLREQWKGCVSKDGDAVSGNNERDNLRADDSGNLVRVGSEADSKVKALQDIVRACVVMGAEK